MTARRPGKLRKVSVIVPCRYSPPTARMPKIRVTTAARPTCAIAWLWTAGSCTLAPETARPVTPATTITGPAASSSQGLRMVVSLRNSVRICGSTAGLLRSDVDMGDGWMRRRSARHRGQPEERRFQGGRPAEFVQRPGEAELSRVDDHHVVGGLGHLAEHVAGDNDGAALVGQGAQQPAQPGDAGGVEAVGRLVEQENLRVAEEGRGQAQALAHAEREPPHPSVRR